MFPADVLLAYRRFFIYFYFFNRELCCNTSFSQRGVCHAGPCWFMYLVCGMVYGMIGRIYYCCRMFPVVNGTWYMVNGAGHLVLRSVV